MSIVRDEKISTRLHKAAAAAALLIAGAMTAGCSHPAVTPAPETHDPTVSAPGPAVVPGAPGTPAPSPLSKGDQEEMQQKQNENKGIAPPP